VTVKKRLIEIVNNFLVPIREKRKEFEAKPGTIKQILVSGIERTQKEAKETLRSTREAMHFNYKSY